MFLSSVMSLISILDTASSSKQRESPEEFSFIKSQQRRREGMYVFQRRDSYYWSCISYNCCHDETIKSASSLMKIWLIRSEVLFFESEIVRTNLELSITHFCFIWLNDSYSLHYMFTKMTIGFFDWHRFFFVQ